MRRKITKLLMLLSLFMGYVISSNAQTATAPSGSGTSGAPYQIASLNNLYWLAEQVNGGNDFSTNGNFIQTANIDASATSGWNSGAGWTAIGGTDNYYVFSGNYDGQGYTISNLYINNPSVNEYGLFGYCSGATIQNLGVTNVSITAGNDVGGIVGYIEPGTIRNCYVTGTVTSKGSTGFAGGICGEAFTTNVDNCYVNCAIVAEVKAAGGLIAYMAGGSLTNSYSSGSVTVNSEALNAGGLLGSIYSGTSVEYCFSESSVSVTGVLHNEPYNADVSNIGGFIGENGGTVANCYSTGSVTAIDAENESEIGGFLGENRGLVSYSYSTGNLSVTPSTGNTPAVGGFVGVNYNESSYGAIHYPDNPNMKFTFTSGTVNNNCFWNSSIYANGCGSNSFTYLTSYTATFSATGKTTAEMKTASTFTDAGWDFAGETTNGSADYWGIGSGYPYLLSLGMKITSSDFSSGDDISAFTKTYLSSGFTITPASHNYCSIESNSSFNGFYALDNNSSSGSGTEFTISSPGYSFDLNAFKYYLDATPSLTITLTFIDGSTDTKTYTFSGSSSGVYEFTNFTTSANDVKSIKFVSDNYMTFNNFSIDDVKVLPVKPTVTTAAISTYNAISATMGGDITADGGATVSERGVVYSSTDATPTIGEANVTKDANGTGSGTFSKSITGLSSNTTYYVCAYATNAAGTNYGTVLSFKTLIPGTWTGLANSSYWTDAANWSDNKVPTATTDVTIPAAPLGGYLPMIYAGDAADCNNLTTAPGYLEIQSSFYGAGSLIVHGTATGLVQTDIYVPKNEWHVVAPACNGYAIYDFLNNGSNQNYLAQKDVSGTIYYGMTDYDEKNNKWNEYFTLSTPGSLTCGKGYILRTTDNSYILVNYGNIVTGTKTVSLTKDGEGWNCIGNPYTSAIYMNNKANPDNNFLKTNAIDNSNLDGSYGCVYVWDQASSTYKILGNYNYGARDLGQSIFQSGQGFFVKAASNGVSVQFTSAMQTHSPETILKSSDMNWNGICINVSDGKASAAATIAFNEDMTTGLDVTYDAGLLRGSNGLSVYTRLVDDNGVDFAIQCLPTPADRFVIPVGVEYAASGKLTFSARDANLPDGCNMLLEDKATGTFTPLADGKEYTAAINEGEAPTGRFFIHLFNETTSANSIANLDMKAYPANGTIYIIGAVGKAATATLSDLLGRKIAGYTLNGGNCNTIPASQLKQGVYLLKVAEGQKSYITKIAIN